jgi:hypothetical protein
MNNNKTLLYSAYFAKKAENIDHDPFMNVVNKATQIIQGQVRDNNSYYSKEYFGGQPFGVNVVDADPKYSIIYVETTPEIQAADGVEQSTNKMIFEIELSDKIAPLGVTVKIR